MKLRRHRHPTPTLYRAGCDAKPTHTFWPKKLLRKHDMVMKTQVLILGTLEKGRPKTDPGQTQCLIWAELGRPWADPGQALGRPWADSGQTLGRPWADPEQTLCL